jgi:phage terminase small subunit
VSLNKRHQRFVEEYCVDLNATQAAIRAGYSEKTAGAIGFKLLKIAEIQEAVAAAQAARSKRVKVDQDWVLRRLVRNVNRSSQAEPVRDRDGNPTGEYQYQGSVVNKALELIGRHLGMFKDKVEVTAAVQLQIVEEIIDNDENDTAAPGASSIPA